MRRFARYIAFVLVVCILASSAAFAATPKASIVSPAANSVVNGDSLLVSVKVADKNSVKVYIYQEMETVTDAKTKKTTLSAVDVSKLTESGIKDIANKFASAAALATKAAVKKYTDVEYSSPAAFTANGELGFFTKQLSNVKPGLYRVQVDTVDKDGKVLETVTSFVAVKEKVAETKTDIFETQQTGAMQFLSNLLKTIFK